MITWNRASAAVFGLGLVLCSLISTTKAGAKTKAAREVAEYIMKKFSQEAATEGEEAIASRLERLAVKHGDEVFEAARRSGPRGIRVLEELGDNSEPAMKLLSKYGGRAVEIARQPKSLELATRFGDDAAEAMIRHPGVAEAVIENFGKPAAAALKDLNGQNARRLAMMVDDSSFAKIPQNQDLLAIIEKYGDRGMDFVWRHKGVFIGGTVVASFWSNPEPYISGVKDITKVVVEKTVAPVAQTFGNEAAKQFPWTLFYAICGLAFTLAVGWLIVRRMRQRTRRSGDSGGTAVFRA
jgi:hypothetical protein